ncbi:DUF86 domain-containing protein [Iocasia frigidifontis]|uniref:DUF86 domain-containing protein n=1 Tax=Iocasia fonsfrigidae TaxID=2682810 RepID=A0A8A7KGZ7_9FIRM|nr:DUF86 domain-containing protein [Iocasia fonsfrigidae]QTL97424.1 DUF86 domain-containing protein [Iocasia fonsfrigidae]
MVDDVLINKKQTINRCIKRINEVYDNNFDNLKDYTKQDSIILNIQRLCEVAIDIAMHVIAEFKLGVPQSSREAFTILNKEGIIDKDLSNKLKAMVGFRNLAVHDYQKLNLKIVKSIIEKHLEDIKKFAEIIKIEVKNRKEITKEEDEDK